MQIEIILTDEMAPGMKVRYGLDWLTVVHVETMTDGLQRVTLTGARVVYTHPGQEIRVVRYDTEER